MDVSIVTSFNEKISRNPHTQILNNVVKYNPEIDTYVYHENSYDLKTYGKNIDFSPYVLKMMSKLHPVDLFKCWDEVPSVNDDWFESFVFGDSSPFNAGKGYWNSHARFWFRKIASIYHCSKLCKTRYLLWLDSDISFLHKMTASGHRERLLKKPHIDSKFFDFIKEYDVCLVLRPARKRIFNPNNHDKQQVKSKVSYEANVDEWNEGSPPDTGVISFDLHNESVLQFIDDLFEYFVGGSVFSNEVRWDDSYVIGRLITNQYADRFNIGTFKNRHSGPNSKNTSPFNIFHEYFLHHKNNTNYRGPDMSPNKKKLEIKLTHAQVKQIIVNALFTNEELKNAFLDSGKVSVKDEWHVFKWQDPSSFVTVTLSEIE